MLLIRKLPVKRSTLRCLVTPLARLHFSGSKTVNSKRGWISQQIRSIGRLAVTSCTQSYFLKDPRSYLETILKSSSTFG